MSQVVPLIGADRDIDGEGALGMPHDPLIMKQFSRQTHDGPGLILGLINPQPLLIFLFLFFFPFDLHDVRQSIDELPILIVTRPDHHHGWRERR